VGGCCDVIKKNPMVDFAPPPKVISQVTTMAVLTSGLRGIPPSFYMHAGSAIKFPIQRA